MQPRRLLWALAGAFAAATVLVFVVALGTHEGRRIDIAVFNRTRGADLPNVKQVGQLALDTIDVVSVLFVAALIVVLALVRRRRRRAIGAGLVFVLAVATAEIGKWLVGHFDPFGQAEARGRHWASSFPSGHATIAAALGFALVLAAPPLLRPVAAVAGAAYAAGIGISVVLLGWHLPSDVVGAYLVAAFWTSVVAAAARTTPRRPSLSPRGVALALVLVGAGLALGALIAYAHSGAAHAVVSSRALVATAVVVGLASSTVFALVTPLVGERAP